MLKLLRGITRAVNTQKVLRQIERIAKSHMADLDSKYCGSVTSLYYGKKEIMESDWWTGKANELCFEGFSFRVPSDYDSVLKHLYGDYMKLPPKDQQVTHHSHQVYWRKDVC